MNIKKIFIGILALLLIQTADARAQAGMFGPQEFGFKAFGTYASKDREDFDDSQLGIGAGINYFFASCFGVEAETYLEDIDFLSHVDISAIGRYPIDQISLAPYAFAGFGRQWRDVAQWTTHLGIGAEYRWSGRMGIFLDGRRVFADKSSDFTLVRFGVQFGF